MTEQPTQAAGMTIVPAGAEPAPRGPAAAPAPKMTKLAMPANQSFQFVIDSIRILGGVGLK